MRIMTTAKPASNEPNSLYEGMWGVHLTSLHFEVGFSDRKNEFEIYPILMFLLCVFYKLYQAIISLTCSGLLLEGMGHGFRYYTFSPISIL